jgi:HNH endonuclease
VKLSHPTVSDLLGRTKKVNECYEWSGKLTTHGYGQLMINSKIMSAHRAMMVAKTEADIPEGMCVLHSCDNPKCINPDHLWIGTQKENMHDKIAKGRGYRPSPEIWAGEKNPKAVLTNAQKQELIELMRSGVSATEAAEIYGITDVRCCQIRKEAGISFSRVRRWAVRPRSAKGEKRYNGATPPTQRSADNIETGE